MIPSSVLQAESLMVTHWREYALMLHQAFGWRVLVCRDIMAGKYVMATCITEANSYADARGTQTRAQATEGFALPNYIWEELPDPESLLIQADPNKLASLFSEQYKWRTNTKTLCKVGIILQRPGKHPRFEPISEAKTITAAAKLWMSQWEDFQRAGRILTIQECDTLRIHGEPTPENRGRFTPAHQHRGIVKSPWETFCDFGSPDCKMHLGFHKSKETAERQFIRNWEVYGRLPGAYCWLETTLFQTKKPPVAKVKAPNPKKPLSAELEWETASAH